MKKTIVQSWNEWDPLKHVIVGRADNCCIPAPEPAVDCKIPPDSVMKGKHGRRTQDSIDRANELLDKFVKTLEGRGIRVDRPTPLKFDEKIATPDLGSRAYVWMYAIKRCYNYSWKRNARSHNEF